MNKDSCDSESDNGCSSNSASLDTSHCRKPHIIIYINTNCKIPCKGRIWNGRCHANYTNGVWKYFTDSINDDYDISGVLEPNNSS